VEFRLIAEAVSPIASAVSVGLSSRPKTLPPWLFYDQRGSELFEQITRLPEYDLTRNERALLERFADEMVLAMRAPVTVVELGAGTATKTGVLLAAAARCQREVLYQPVDVSESALTEARRSLNAKFPGVRVEEQVANYVADGFRVEREPGHKVLALYLGSSIGNFSPQEAQEILRGLRRQLQPGDGFLLGTDLAPGPHKREARLVAAYDDAAGVTAAFNRNMLVRLNRELGANFRPECFRHEARWNAAESRMEMHLVAAHAMSVRFGGAAMEPVKFVAGESIHTENSYKFTRDGVQRMLAEAGFGVTRRFADDHGRYALTLAVAEAGG
jgi:dimethylhistidine N-methyltransferase